MDSAEYCREIETYLCKKNDGHLIRVVGPSFALVSGWAERGVPLKVALRGIDRYFERYYREGPRRRPVRIDFCEADVLDVFDEWRRAVGLTAVTTADPETSGEGVEQPAARGPSLPAHLERVLLRLTTARVKGVLGEAADPALDRVSAELDVARASARGVRGEARRALLERLIDLDAQLLAIARRSLPDADLRAIERSADEELAPFKPQMAVDAYARAHVAAVDRLIRERAGLPIVALP
ncbi:MAG TPA: hypothetical protein VH417_12630 [Vicinamibacterales bacterium]|jgi:hypothetical protein